MTNFLYRRIWRTLDRFTLVRRLPDASIVSLKWRLATPFIGDRVREVPIGLMKVCVSQNRMNESVCSALEASARQPSFRTLLSICSIMLYFTHIFKTWKDALHMHVLQKYMYCTCVRWYSDTKHKKMMYELRNAPERIRLSTDSIAGAIFSLHSKNKTAWTFKTIALTARLFVSEFTWIIMQISRIALKTVRHDNYELNCISR